MSFATDMNRLRLMSRQELIDEMESLCADPANRMPPGRVWLYTAKTRKKLDLINRAIFEKREVPNGR